MSTSIEKLCVYTDVGLLLPNDRRLCFKECQTIPFRLQYNHPCTAMSDREVTRWQHNGMNLNHNPFHRLCNDNVPCYGAL